MTNEFPQSSDIAVVGGGLAGLTAATFLARAGYEVTLLEQSQQLGGRAITHVEKGFHFNLGPRALYRAGQGEKILQELGIQFSGGIPSLNGGYAIRQGRKHAFPAGMLSLLTTRLFGLSSKLEINRLFASLGKIDPKSVQNLTLREWLDQEIKQPAARQFFEALVRLWTYANAPEQMSAEVAIAQGQLVFAGLVYYIDGGWQVLVNGLCQVARAAGVRIVTGAKVAAVEHDKAVRSIRLATGERCQASAIILATSPKVSLKLVEDGQNTSLHQWATAAIPVQAACLDVALKRLPQPRNRFALGIDQPIYFSVHSPYANLAPNGCALIHTAKYLGSTASQKNRATIEQELEAVLDLLQPGWRNELVVRRFLPDIVVSNALVTAAQGGTASRPGPAVPEIDNLYVVGDWVGHEGLLADAALSSAKQAAEMIVSSGLAQAV